MYVHFFKRFLDFIFSIVLFPFFVLICLFIIPAIKLEDGGPAFYNSERLGRGGKVFLMHKFRSMKVNSPDIRLDDGSTFNSPNDDRQTKIGQFLRKTSLDELPQLLNVLKGEMSFVGPRPDLPSQEKLYEGDDYEKLSVRPGITGYSQAYFRNSVEWKKRLKSDVYYANNVSVLLDVRIVLKTILTVIRRDNVYSAE